MAIKTDIEMLKLTTATTDKKLDVLLKKWDDLLHPTEGVLAKMNCEVQGHKIKIGGIKNGMTAIWSGISAIIVGVIIAFLKIRH